jgi:hypothetical protein
MLLELAMQPLEFVAILMLQMEQPVMMEIVTL